RRGIAASVVHDTQERLALRSQCGGCDAGHAHQTRGESGASAPTTMGSSGSQYASMDEARRRVHGSRQTRLLYKNTWRVDSANRLFGACYDGNTVVIVNPGRSPFKPYIRVPEGTYALVQNQGRDLDYVNRDGSTTAIWPPGYHAASLFTKVAHLVTKQDVVFDTPVKGCKTADDVTVTIDMCLVFRIMGDPARGEDPELVRRFVYELGPNGLEVQLRAAQDEAVRSLARSVQHTEVYQLRDGTMKERFQTGALNFRKPDGSMGSKELDEADTGSPKVATLVYCVMEDIKRNLNMQFNSYGVQITNVMITDVKLPDQFQEQMQSRTTHISAIKEQNMKQMSDMQLLQYKEEIDTTKLERKMMLMEEESRGKARCAEIQKEIDLIQADSVLVGKQIEQEMLVQCNKINANAELKIAHLKAETDSITTEIALHCDADVEIIKAKIHAMRLELAAITDEITVSAEAQKYQIVAEAEGIAAKKLVMAREHELGMRKLEVLDALAHNKQTVVSGDASNNLLADILVADRQRNVLINVDGRSNENPDFGTENHQTRLLYQETWRVDSANRFFGACSNGNTVIIINPGRSPIKPYIRVPEGTYALVQNQGKDMDYTMEDGTRSAVWLPGFHFASIFTKVSHLVTKQYIVFETPVKGCKTADDVTVRIDMCLVIRIMGDRAKGEDPGLVRRFVYELGPNGLEVQLRAAQDEAVRALARSVLHTEVYKLRDGTLRENFATGGLDMLNGRGPPQPPDEVVPINNDPTHDKPADGPTVRDPSHIYFVTEDIKKNLNLQFNTYGVQITSVAITNVKLPSQFQEQMQSKTTHLSTIKEQNMKQLSDMQLLQYKEEIDTTKLARKMMLMEEEQTGKAKCAEIQKEIDMVAADTKMIQDQLQQETKVKCNRVTADTALTIEQIHAETQKISTEISFRCDTEIQLLEAEKEALRVQLNAQIDEIRISGEAKALEISAKAEGVAAKKLEKYRQHMLDIRRLDLLTSLAKNDKVVVTGNPSNSLLAEMMVANQQGNIMLNVGENGLKNFMKSA
ncbi:TPA: hypothetical protein N0F65_001977, partial [Lagenidium giganteum]